MPIQIKMPQLSDTMHSGKILSWKRSPGDKISRGDILAEVETEKANLEIESFHQGVLLEILIPAGSQAGVGDVIAVLGAPGEVSATGNSQQSARVEAPAPVAQVSAAPVTGTPAATSSSAPQLIPNFSPAYSLAQGASTIATTSMSASHESNNSSGRVRASPLAKRIAQERNVDLTLVRGSGPDGRIVRKDVEGSAAVSAPAPSAPAPFIPAPFSPAPANMALSTEMPRATSVAGSVTPMSKMRALIASRMQDAVREAPHFYVTTKINMGEAKRFYAALKLRPEFSGVSLNHLIIKAAAYGLSKEPRVNNAVKDGGIYNPGQINIGVITSVEDGLLIPVIKNADKLPLTSVVSEARGAIERAKSGRPTSADLSGGTFSISNMGMFDVDNFTAIINPGQGAVLAVSSTVAEPVVINGQIVIGEMMKVTLSVDHRIIDGVMGATFLKFFKEALEMPALLAL